MPPTMTSKEKLKSIINTQDRIIRSQHTLLKGVLSGEGRVTQDDMDRLEKQIVNLRKKSRALLARGR